MVDVPGCYAMTGQGDGTAAGHAAVVGAILFAAGCLRDVIEIHHRP